MHKSRLRQLFMGRHHPVIGGASAMLQPSSSSSLVSIIALLITLCILVHPATAKFKFNHHPDDGMCQRAGRPYLIAEVNGGLNNARWVMLEYLASASKHNLTFVAGTLNMELMGECGNTVGFQPFSTLYSIDTLLDFARRHNISVVTEISPTVQETCCQALEKAQYAQDPVLDNVEQWLQTRHPDQAVCLNYHQGFYLLPNSFGRLAGWSSVDFSTLYMEAQALDPFRAALQPSPAVRQLVTYVLRALRRLYGDEVLRDRRTAREEEHAGGVGGAPGGGRRVLQAGGGASGGAASGMGGPSSSGSLVAQQEGRGSGERFPATPMRFSFTTVHVRIENDFRGHCAHFSKIARQRCFFKEEEIAMLLRDKYQVAPGSLLHVASGEPLSAMPTLCSTFRCFRALDIWEQGPLKDTFGRCTTREAKGAVEFWVAAHASAFYGNIHSSFSAELVAEFRRMGKPGLMYTEPCGSDDESCT